MEVLAVLALVGLMVAGSAPSVARAVRVARLRNAATTVAAQLRAAKTFAEASGHEHRVLLEDGAISVQDVSTGTYEPGRRRIPLAQDVEVDASVFGGTVRFSGDGTAQDGDITLTAAFPGRSGERARSTVSVFRSGLVRQRHED